MFNSIRSLVYSVSDRRGESPVSDPRADNILMRERNARIDDAPPFLGIEQIDRWYEAESFDALLKRNQAALEYLREQLIRFKAKAISERESNIVNQDM